MRRQDLQGVQACHPFEIFAGPLVPVSATPVSTTSASANGVGARANCVWLDIVAQGRQMLGLRVQAACALEDDKTVLWGLQQMTKRCLGVCM